jgi:hypothetical protein
MMLGSLLDTRSSFVIAALFVSWIAVALLMLVVGNLHVRLQRLEQLNAAPKEAMPYGQMLGRRLHDLVAGPVPVPGVLLFLSTNCSSCKRVLDELGAPGRSAPVTIAWIDQTPAPTTAAPPNTIVLAEGPQISAALGIRVTPFVVVSGEDGRVIKATPVSSLSSLGELVGSSTSRFHAHVPNDRVKGVAP